MLFSGSSIEPFCDDIFFRRDLAAERRYTYTHARPDYWLGISSSPPSSGCMHLASSFFLYRCLASVSSRVTSSSFPLPPPPFLFLIIIIRCCVLRFVHLPVSLPSLAFSSASPPPPSHSPSSFLLFLLLLLLPIPGRASLTSSTMSNQRLLTFLSHLSPPTVDTFTPPTPPPPPPPPPTPSPSPPLLHLPPPLGWFDASECGRQPAAVYWVLPGYLQLPEVGILLQCFFLYIITPPWWWWGGGKGVPDGVQRPLACQFDRD